MKTKSFAMLAASGLLIASTLYIAPAMADEFSNEMPMEQTLADNSNSSGSSTIGALDNSTSNQSNSTSQQNDSSSASQQNNDSNNSNNSNSTGNDEGSPDTATGDDDY
jgi:hypothetical protein